MTLRRNVSVRNGVRRGASFGLPLVSAGRALAQFPLVAEESLEKAVVPFDWSRCPRAFKTAGDGVGSDTGAKTVAPAKPLLLDRCAFRLSADICRSRRAVSLAERVATCDEGDGFFIVHCHAGKGFADIARGCHGVGVAVGPLRVNINPVSYTHLTL